jgi:hypothetical protein
MTEQASNLQQADVAARGPQEHLKNLEPPYVCLFGDATRAVEGTAIGMLWVQARSRATSGAGCADGGYSTEASRALFALNRQRITLLDVLTTDLSRLVSFKGQPMKSQIKFQYLWN